MKVTYMTTVYIHWISTEIMKQMKLKQIYACVILANQL